MNIKSIQSLEKIPINKQEWNALVAASEINSPFQTYEWFTSWWSVFGADYDLCLLLGYENGRLVGIAPFMIGDEGHEKVLRFISDINADYCDFIVAKEDKRKFIRDTFVYLQQHQKNWDSADLINIPEESSTTTHLNDTKEFGLFASTSKAICPVLKLERTDPTADMWATKTLKRHFNYFKKSGELQFIVFDSLEEAIGTLDDFYDQHIKRWRSVRRSSLFDDIRYRMFYKKLLEEAWSSGWIFFSSLRFNDHQIAFHYGFDYNSKVIWYKPSFDVSFSKRSPGRLLLSYLIDYCQQEGKKELDFSVGDEQFKHHYANAIRNNMNFRLFRTRKAFIHENFSSILRHSLKKVFQRFRLY